MHETIAAAAAAGAPLHIVHVNSSAGDEIDGFLAAITAARAAGQDVTTEAYPYGAGMTEIQSALFDDWATWPDARFGSHALAEIANIAPDTHQAYVGTSAFAHKAGLHASAIKVDPELYNHMDPVDVGNGQRVLVTEMAGRASVELKGRRARPGPGRPSRRGVGGSRDGQGAGGAGLVVRGRRRLAGAADARARSATAVRAPFTLESYRVITEHRADGEVVAEATVKVRRATGERLIATAEGNGPVNALDAALRAALTPSCPWLDDVELSDYKVRILDPGGSAAAPTP